MNMRGKGFSSCLLCESEKDLLLGDKLIQKIIKLRYGTDTFEVMLQHTKVCIKCIGRLQQLNDFCSYNEIASPKYKSEDDKICDMCRLSYSSYEIIPPSKSIADDIEFTKWLKKREKDEEFICCFSCYNFTLLYNDTKKQLTQLLDYFYSTLNKCKVIIVDCGHSANQQENFANIEQEQFFGSLSLTPVPISSRTRRSRVSFAPDIEIILQPPENEQNVAKDSTEPIETESRSPAILVDNEVPAKPITRKLRISIGNATRVVPKISPKAGRSRNSTGSIANDLNVEALKKKYNITECNIPLTRLPVIASESINSDMKSNKGSAKKKSLKIKLNAKSKIINRQMKRSMQKPKNKELDNNLDLEVVMTEINLNNSQSSTMSADPLNTSVNDVEAQNTTSSFSLDDTLPIMSPEHSNNTAVVIIDEDNNNKVVSKENNVVSKVRSPRKTRNSAGKLTESTNVVPQNSRAIKKRKSNVHVVRRKPTKKQKLINLEQQETSENVSLIEDDACEEYLSSPEEPESNLEESYLTEIEFLHPKYNNKAVKFESSSTNDDLDFLSTSQENCMSSLSTEEMNLSNAEYLDESLEEIMNTRHSPQNDALCPIYTMDQLLNEDSLLSIT